MAWVVLGVVVFVAQASVVLRQRKAHVGVVVVHCVVVSWKVVLVKIVHAHSGVVARNGDVAGLPLALYCVRRHGERIWCEQSIRVVAGRRTRVLVEFRRSSV